MVKARLSLFYVIILFFFKNIHQILGQFAAGHRRVPVFIRGNSRQLRPHGHLGKGAMIVVQSVGLAVSAAASRAQCRTRPESMASSAALGPPPHHTYSARPLAHCGGRVHAERSPALCRLQAVFHHIVHGFIGGVVFGTSYQISLEMYPLHGRIEHRILERCVFSDGADAAGGSAHAVFPFFGRLPPRLSPFPGSCL